MEIKKYVLLKNNTIGKLYERYNLGFLYVEKKGGTVYIKNALLSDVKLTSDNILDLVEVGDLFRHVCGQIYEITFIDETHLFYNLGVSKTPKWIKNVVAIYKRQSNGDYKRYEVVKNGN